jgi:hypothetical protein
MKAQVHNDAKGWDAATPEAIAAAETDPADPAAIKGNFTKEELPANLGYTLPVGLGHSGDYAGYTVSYREYMNRDSYRKALTSYGPHTADYMNTRLARMAGYLKGGPALPDEPTHALGVADEQRQAAEAKALGQLSSYYFDGWNAQLADDVGPAAALVQPPLSITRFQSATFTWRGGGNFVDNPTVRVERQLPDGTWEAYADMSGEVQTVLALPDGVTSHATTRAGVQEWEWTANFEAFDGYKRFGRPGTQTPNGNYRFVADGNIRQAGAIEDYTVTSRVFAVGPWTGLVAGDPRLEAGNAVSVPVTEPNYPRTYSSAFLFIKDDGAGANAVCETCAFRPWARSSTPQDVTITVVRDGTVLRRVPATLSGDRWVAPVALQPGELAFVERGMALDEYSEINGAPSKAIGVDGVLVAAPEITSDPEPVVPEVPVPALLLVAAVAIAYGAFRRSRRTP